MFNWLLQKSLYFDVFYINIDIDNSKKSILNHQLNIAILKIFAYYDIYILLFFFSSQIYLKPIFYKTQGFLY